MTTLPRGNHLTLRIGEQDDMGRGGKVCLYGLLQHSGLPKGEADKRYAQRYKKDVAPPQHPPVRLGQKTLHKPGQENTQSMRDGDGGLQRTGWSSKHFVDTPVVHRRYFAECRTLYHAKSNLTFEVQ